MGQAAHYPVPFDFQGTEVRALIITGEPWWVASDVCRVLGYRDAEKGTRLLDDDEKGTHSVGTLGGNQDLTVVNESGLYSLILRSKKPSAKAFKKWVTKEVLPAIRKTGKYEVNPIRNPVTEIDKLAETANKLFPALSERIGEVRTTLIDHDDRLTAVEEKQRRLDPRAIDERMFVLHQIKRLLVTGTKGMLEPVTHQKYWKVLQEHCRVASFQNRAALDVPLMDRAIEHARKWCHERGVQPPTLFD